MSTGRDIRSWLVSTKPSMQNDNRFPLSPVKANAPNKPRTFEGADMGPCDVQPKKRLFSSMKGLEWKEDLTRAKYLEHVAEHSAGWVLPALMSSLRSCKLSPTAIQAVHDVQRSVRIPAARGRHSLMEGDFDEAVSVLELTGFPVERREAEIHSGTESMFPPHVVTGRLLALDAAERAPRLYLDAVSVPGVTKPDGKPDWPPETEDCLARLSDQLVHLLNIPFHRLHGVVPAAAYAKAMKKLDYDRAAPLPSPRNTDVVVTLYANSRGDPRRPPVVSIRTVHASRVVMSVVGQDERIRDARTFDNSSTLLDMFIRDVPFAVEPRLQSVVESDKGGGRGSVKARREFWSQQVFGRSFTDLSSHKQCIILTALEGALCYAETAEEWQQLRPALERLFAGTPSIVEVVSGSFDQRRAGKNIRQSDRGVERMKGWQKQPATEPGVHSKHKQDSSTGGMAGSNLGSSRGGKGMASDTVFIVYRDLAGTTVGWLTTTNGTGNGYKPSSTSGDLKDKLGYLKSRFAKGQDSMKIPGAERRGIITVVSADYATEAAAAWIKKQGRAVKWIMQKAASQEVDHGPFDRWEEWEPRFGKYTPPAEPSSQAR